MRPRIGVALGSGGARGFCHIGVLQALVERRTSPDVIAGASIGALVGAVYAAGKLEELEAWARSLTRVSFARLLDLNLGSGGLVHGRALERLFGDIGLPDRIEDLPLPFVAVATDMVTGAEHWFKEGSLFDAVRASIALPGVISPHFVGGRWLLDGGLVNPIPVSAARMQDAQIIIAVNPNARLDGVIWRSSTEAAQKGDLVEGDNSQQGFFAALPEQMQTALLSLSSPIKGPVPPSYMQVLTASIEIMIDHIQRSRLAGDPPHVQLNGTLGAMSIFDFHMAAGAIAEGHEMVRRNEDFIEALTDPGV
ncbi:patatin-like phospholipase family protein [Actibacterium sp. 188UL27-1]|uniref:patatin-like phospholipase family protein n=1 Tax=Actibacterium sp. 188UL27-1 TaxID=2786961 RepID=UPI00195C44EE|nr:patatin-like phospholipase family protein [Actibacterium sp. 188UL27-1]MBM7069664.1 patatin-like phospholipase family protein [Actibacterium sp. 188UL27-1]